MSIDKGDPACTSGMSKLIKDAWQASSLALGGGAPSSAHTGQDDFCYVVASGVSDEVNADLATIILAGAAPSLSNSNPSNLGTAAPGTASDVSRHDHVHAMPSASDVGAVATSRNVSTTAPLTGGGDLSANRTLALSYSTGLTVSGGNLVVDTATIATKSYADTGDAARVPATRTINTTSPISGGGDLSADRTLSFAVASEARGDVLYRNATTWTRLPAGTSGQVLQTNGISADPSWVTPASAGVSSARQINTSAPLSGGGDLSADRTLTLGYSTGLTVSGSNLVVDTSTIATRSYAAPATRLINTTAPLSGGGDLSADRTLSFAVASEAQGDILIRGASGWTRLAAGTSGNVLQTNGASANPSWVTAPAVSRNTLYQSSFTTAFATSGASHDYTLDANWTDADQNQTASGLVPTARLGDGSDAPYFYVLNKANASACALTGSGAIRITKASSGTESDTWPVSDTGLIWVMPLGTFSEITVDFTLSTNLNAQYTGTGFWGIRAGLLIGSTSTSTSYAANAGALPVVGANHSVFETAGAATLSAEANLYDLGFTNSVALGVMTAFVTSGIYTRRLRCKLTPLAAYVYGASSGSPTGTPSTLLAGRGNAKAGLNKREVFLSLGFARTANAAAGWWAEIGNISVTATPY